MFVGAYDEPPDPNDMPPLEAVFIGENLGPFRTLEYAKGTRALTRFRDWVSSTLDGIGP